MAVGGGEACAFVIIYPPFEGVRSPRSGIVKDAVQCRDRFAELDYQRLIGRVHRRAGGGASQLFLPAAGDGDRPCTPAADQVYSGRVSRTGGVAVSWRVFLQSLSEILDGVRVSPVCCRVAAKAQGSAKICRGRRAERPDAGGDGAGGGEPVLSPAERRGGGRGTGTKRHFEIRDGVRLSGLRQRKQLAGRRLRHGGRAADYGLPPGGPGDFDPFRR